MRASDHPAHTTHAAKLYPAHPPFVKPHNNEVNSGGGGECRLMSRGIESSFRVAQAHEDLGLEGRDPPSSQPSVRRRSRITRRQINAIAEGDKADAETSVRDTPGSTASATQRSRERSAPPATRLG